MFFFIILAPGPETIKKSRAWIGALLTILCSINRKLRSGDYKEIGVLFFARFEFRTQTKVNKSQTQ